MNQQAAQGKQMVQDRAFYDQRIRQEQGALGAVSGGGTTWQPMQPDGRGLGGGNRGEIIYDAISSGNAGAPGKWNETTGQWNPVNPPLEERTRQPQPVPRPGLEKPPGGGYPSPAPGFGQPPYTSPGFPSPAPSIPKQPLPPGDWDKSIPNPGQLGPDGRPIYANPPTWVTWTDENGQEHPNYQYYPQPIGWGQPIPQPGQLGPDGRPIYANPPTWTDENGQEHPNYQYYPQPIGGALGGVNPDSGLEKPILNGPYSYKEFDNFIRSALTEAIAAFQRMRASQNK